jgi:hypothetical protein
MIHRTFSLVFVLCLFTDALVFAQSRSALLVRGNAWITGLPGIEENAFPCFFGNYRLDGLDSGPAVFSVYICRETVLFDGRIWLSREGLPGPAVQRADGEVLFIGLSPVSSGNPASAGGWTFLFRFSENKPGDEAINRLIDAWTARFRYFFSLVKSISDVSLPAVVNF